MALAKPGRPARCWPDRGCGTEPCSPTWGVHSQGPGAPRCHQPALCTEAQTPDTPRTHPASKMSCFSINQDSLSLVSLHLFIHTCLGHLLHAGPPRPASANVFSSSQPEAHSEGRLPRPRWPLIPCCPDRSPGQCGRQVPAPCLVTSDTDVTVCWGRPEVTSRGQTGSQPSAGREGPPGSSPTPPACGTGSHVAPPAASGTPPGPTGHVMGLGTAASPTHSAEPPEFGFGGQLALSCRSAVLLDAYGTQAEAGGRGNGSW